MWKQTESSSKGVNPQDGEGWLVNDQQGLVCEFSVDDPSIQDSWITVRTFRWRKPDYPIPQSRRRLLRDGAIEEWKRMQAAGWRRCFPPVRWITLLLNAQKYVRLLLRQRILVLRIHSARTDKSDDMSKKDLTARREIKQAETQSDAAQLTGYESPQRRRFLRELAAEEPCGE